MKVEVTYRIETAHPEDTGLSRIVFNVIGSWPDGRGGRWKNGTSCCYGCETIKEAKSVLRILKERKPFAIV